MTADRGRVSGKHLASRLWQNLSSEILNVDKSGVTFRLDRVPHELEFISLRSGSVEKRARLRWMSRLDLKARQGLGRG